MVWVRGARSRDLVRGRAGVRVRARPMVRAMVRARVRVRVRVRVWAGARLGCYG